MKTDWSGSDLQLDSRRQRLLDLFELLLHGVDDLDCVCAGLSPDIESYRLPVVQITFQFVGSAKLSSTRPMSLTRIGDAVTFGDDDVAELAHRVDSAQRPNGKLVVAPNDAASGNLDVLALDRLLELIDGDAVGIHLLGIGEETYLPGTRPGQC